MDYDKDAEHGLAEHSIVLLNEEQRAAFDKIMESADGKLGRIFFVNSPGGTGKTFLDNTLCHQARSQGNIVLCSALSGIAALLMPGGRTSHSTFKIPIDGLNDRSFCNIPKTSQRADLLRKTARIFWDDVGMQDCMAIEAVDRTINKAQDQSVKFVGLDLHVPVFSHGQLYVALSRATSEHRIKVLLANTVLTPTTKNVVHPEVLLD